MGRHVAARRPRTFRRVRAVLAGALVLGVGATMTLAAWTDTEFASGSFTASRFDTESNADGSGWASNINPPVATFTAATGMSPTVSKFTTLDVRTTATTSVSGSVLLTATGKTGTLGDVLEYRVVRAATTSSTCDSTAFTNGSAVFVAGNNATTPVYVTGGTMPTTPPSQTIAAAGGLLRYCFDVRIKAGTAMSYQGATGTLTWTFTSTSAN